MYCLCTLFKVKFLHTSLKLSTLTHRLSLTHEAMCSSVWFLSVFCPVHLKSPPTNKLQLINAVKSVSKKDNLSSERKMWFSKSTLTFNILPFKISTSSWDTGIKLLENWVATPPLTEVFLTKKIWPVPIYSPVYCIPLIIMYLCLGRQCKIYPWSKVEWEKHTVPKTKTPKKEDHFISIILMIFVWLTLLFSFNDTILCFWISLQSQIFPIIVLNQENIPWHVPLCTFLVDFKNSLMSSIS